MHPCKNNFGALNGIPSLSAGRVGGASERRSVRACPLRSSGRARRSHAPRSILSPILALAILVAATCSTWAQDQYIGYVYPAGGQQGTTFPVRLGGQGLVYASDLVVSGDGVTVRLVDYYQVL